MAGESAANSVADVYLFVVNLDETLSVVSVHFEQALTEAELTVAGQPRVAHPVIAAGGQFVTSVY